MPFPKINLVILIMNTYLYSIAVSNLFHKGLDSKHFRPVGLTVSVATIPLRQSRTKAAKGLTHK